MFTKLALDHGFKLEAVNLISYLQILQSNQENI